MKKNLLFLLILLLPVASYASEYNEFRYSTNTNTNTCTITGHTAACTGDVTIPSILGGCKVTSIGEEAFKYCTGLTSITIPNSVTSIGVAAFSGCSRLTSITIPNSVTLIGTSAFYNCTGLTKVTIPNSVKTIGERTFSGCSNLTSITISNSVTKIFSRAFSGCTGLTSITIPNSVTYINESAFEGCTGLASLNVESGNPVYDSRDNCNAIIITETNKLIFGTKNTVIPNSVTSINESAFEGCTGLTSITIPNSVTFIGMAAFSGCSNLTSITIFNSVTKIGSRAFSGCTGLTSITIPNSVTLIGTSAFYNCTGLTKVTIPKSVTYISMSAFESCSGLTSVTIPNSVTYIEKYAFQNCSSLTSVTIPNSVTSIQNSAFQNCSSLTSITIPNSVTSINERTFSGCSNLTSITIPNSVTSINESAFEGCTGLISVKVNSKTPFTITDKVFTNRANATLCVPAGSKAAYESAYYWKDFKEIITDPYFLVFSNNLDGNWSVTGYTDACTGNVTIPSSKGGHSVTSIGERAFNGCTGLTKVTIPNSVTSIGIEAFSECTNLTLVTIPNSVTTISESTFKRCTGLTSVTIPNSVTSIGVAAFSGCSNLTSITIPNSVTYINGSAFYCCSRLTSVTIPNSVTSIGSFAFHCCSRLTSVTIPNSVTEIGIGAFSDCTILHSVTIPNSVTEIGYSAFAYCTNLTSVTVKAETPLTITELVFTNRANATLYVPAGSKAAYEAADYWKEFKEIKEIGMTSPTGITGLIYTGSAQDLIKAGASNMRYSLDGTNYGTTIPQGTDAKEYTVYYKVEGNESVSTIKVTISPKTVSSPTISLSQTSYTYDGTAKEPTVTVKDGETTISAEEYAVGYSNNTNAGTATVTISDKEGGNYNVSGSSTFTIERSVPSGNIVFASDKVKAACVAKWDTDKDGELSYDEAAAVTRLIENSNAPFAQLLLDPEFTSFDEFQYFTGITYLFGYEFSDCENLTSIKLPNSITGIGFGAFRNCPLTSIHIPASVTNINMGNSYIKAFNSQYLQAITVDPENTKYASPEGSNAIIEFIDEEHKTLILGCGNTDFTKLEGVTTIRDQAFQLAVFPESKTSIILPATVTEILYGAFDHTNITSINLGDLTGLTTLGDFAFTGCKGLTEVTIPASITNRSESLNGIGMGDCVFYDCTNIIKVVSEIEEPFEISKDMFHDFNFCTNNAVLYVPKDKVKDYIDNGWEEIDNYLKIQSFRVITHGNSTAPEAIGGLTYNGKDQKLILPGTYRDGMMEYSLDNSNYSTSIPTGKEAGEYTVYYRKKGLNNVSTLKVTIAAPKTISVFSGSNLWAGYVATENLAIPTGLEAYVITNLGATTATASSLNYIPQGVPVLLKRNNASVNDYEISTGTGTAPTVNLLKTYNSDKNVSNREGFILYNDEFVLVNEGILPAGRVFLPANGSGRALTRTIVFDRDDIVDFGDSQEKNDDSNQWYDIQGRKLERKPTKKGIYILDGRKVVIK